MLKKYSLFLLIFCLLSTGCGSSDSEAPTTSKTPITTTVETPEEKKGPLRDSTPQIIETNAPGEVVYETEIVSIDVSNLSAGYLSLNYSGTNEKVKFQIVTPDGTACTYLVSDYNTDIVYPLTGGNGSYTISLFESVDPAEDRYAIAFTEDLAVTVSDEFLPFLTPNIYIDFTADSSCVSKGTELAKDCYSDLDVVNQIYHHVIGNIVYDEAKAKSVPYGYIPDPDETLASQKGICFDYASLMSAMLRSQRIPTKLEVGYAGEVYHAWISCYVAEIGWVDNIIEFDGESWSLMDPTLAANNSSDAVSKYIGDGSKYIVKYTY